jgi:hypothetical protein
MVQRLHADRSARVLLPRVSELVRHFLERIGHGIFPFGVSGVFGWKGARGMISASPTPGRQRKKLRHHLGLIKASLSTENGCSPIG